MNLLSPQGLQRWMIGLNGVQWSAMERSGIEWNGMEWNGRR
jgi:hypothetical protein